MAARCCKQAVVFRTLFWTRFSERKPGNPVPIDPVPVEMRQEDRERLPIGIVPVMAMGVTPMAARRGILRHRRRCRLGGLWRDRGTRHADRRLGRCGLGWRRSGRWRLRILGAAGESSRKHEQSRNGGACAMVSHLSHPLSRLFRVHAELVIGRALRGLVGASRK